MVILILILVAFLIAYIMGLCAMTSFLPYALGLLVLGVVGSVIVSACGETKLSAEQLKQIRAAEELDRKNALLNAEIGERQAKKEAYATISQKREEIASLIQQVMPLKNELEQHFAAIDGNDVLANDDKDIATIDFLISKLEGRRANSITEALLLLDAKREKDEENKRRKEQEIARMQFETNMRILQEKQRAQREWEASLEQATHNRRMEEQAKRLVDEAETMRKNQEYYQRYGRL